jgi:outer membrane protein assembly factor BamA
MLFDPAFGSDYRFSRTALDIRHFTPIGWRHVIAFQFYNLLVEGEAPFQLLPEIGGQVLMRGYAQGRYKNNIMLALQAEYRLIVYGPVGFVVFASAADVQRRFEDVGSDRLILSAGPGMRFLINDEVLNFLIDYGIGRDGGAFYFTLGEAF